MSCVVFMTTPWIVSQFGPNSGYIEELYNLFKFDPALVGETWRKYFEDALATGVQETAAEVLESNGHALPVPAALAYAGEAPNPELLARAYRLVSAYRGRGHLAASINPLSAGITPPPVPEDIALSFYGFTQTDLAQVVPCAGFAGHENLALSQLVSGLKEAYCGPLGFEFTHLLSQEERLWIQDRIEKRFTQDYTFSRERKIRWLQRMIDGEVLEAEFNKRYGGQTRFSIEGGEVLFAVLDAFIDSCLGHEAEEVVIGMSHRARVNVLVNTLAKPLEELLTEFEDRTLFTVIGAGDVKYHMGYSSVVRNREGRELKLTLTPNPSHLEFIDPVVQGVTRARQDIAYGSKRNSVVPLLMHGDASFIGQGIVFETLNFSNVGGYTTGGTVHIIINNQVGFTTDPQDSRSSTYCTDLAKAVQAPILHVNGEDVEAACWAVAFALDFRMRYGRDVVLDIYCYRKHGHNEGDDPSFTQPVTYTEVREKSPVAQLYAAKLVAENIISREEVDGYIAQAHERVRTCHERSKKIVFGDASPVHGRLRGSAPDTAVPSVDLLKIAELFENFPADFTPHPKLQKILEKRVQTVRDGEVIEWGFAEVLAYGSLVKDGIRVRLSGQDCGRGTFSQRHVILSDYKTGSHYLPYSQLYSAGGSFAVINSTLSEAGILGFEFGYGTVADEALVLWEGQFGDFVNGAQVIIDQFIASSEAKWNQRSGVVLLLPHGAEGRGPEHSSARLERFLQLCAEGNMSVCYPSTAAQYFHLLRRQALSPIKRPLIVMTPKSLLRLASASCSLKDLSQGSFKPVIGEEFGSAEAAQRAILLSGKIYHDFLPELQKFEKGRLRVIRVEEFHPFPEAEIKRALSGIPSANVAWVQEEPQNAGAWEFMQNQLRQRFDIEPRYIGRPAGASPATGSAKRHAMEQRAIVEAVIHSL